MQVLHPPNPLRCAPSGCGFRHQALSSHASTHRSLLPAAHGMCACASDKMCAFSGGGGSERNPRQTASHLFDEGDKLGKGGSCDVYSGVEKGTGRQHALKAARGTSQLEQSQLLREAETLAKLDSSKIVKLYGQNYEVDTGRPVVVLEYCNGGSLLSFLHLPENVHGLNDEDFLTLLRDLVEALSYLRGKGIVHRDLKPGNILRHVQDNGKCEYKLTDFGTSRETVDSDQMTSIVGTEEYLHPALYKGAFFDNNTHSEISPMCGELWSVGCTLYHAITGSVPFRPLGGPRHNRKAMLVMISQKPARAICGDQRLDGTFQWSCAIPNDCRMSESLRGKVTPLLQNLLETNPSHQWSFATFLDESQRILGMHCLHVCDTECGELFLLYMSPKQSLAELQDTLAFHTEIPAAQQQLFHRVQPLLSMLGPSGMVRDLPDTQWVQPLLLMSSKAGAEGRCRRHVIAQPKLLGPEASLEEDIASSGRACSDLYTHVLMALTLSRLPNLLFSALLALRSTVTSTQSTVETRFRVLSATCQERQSRMAILSQLLRSLHPASPKQAPPCPSSPLLSKLSQAKAICDQLRDRLWQLKYRLDEFRRGATDLTRTDTSVFDTLGRDESCDTVRHMFERAKEVWGRMQERRQHVPLSQLHQDKHKGDRATFNRLCLESTKRLKSVYAKRAALLGQFSHQVRQVYERLDNAQEMDSQLQTLKEDSEQFSTLLDEIWKTGSEDLHKVTEAGRSALSAHTVSPVRSQLKDLLSEGLPNLDTFNLPAVDTRKK